MQPCLCHVTCIKKLSFSFLSFGLLLSQTRVLVTHGLSFLSQADLVLVMEDGRLTESGSYQQLMERQGAFSKFINTFDRNQRKEPITSREKSTKLKLHLSKRSQFFK